MRHANAVDAIERRDHAIIAEFPALPGIVEPPAVVSQATVFRLYPNKRQAQAFGSWMGAGRWTWNRFCEINEQIYQAEGRFAFHAELSSLLSTMKKAKGLEWLAEPPAIHLVDVSRRYDSALRRFLGDRRKVAAGTLSKGKAAGFPRFKKKRDSQGSVYLSPQTFTLIKREATDKARGWIELPGMDETVVWTKATRKGVSEKTVNLRHAVRIRGGRWPDGTIRSATIKYDGDRWFLCVQFDGQPPEKHGDPVEIATGYDLGCGKLAVGSDGTLVPAGRNLRKARKKLRRHQRSAARRYQARLARQETLREKDSKIHLFKSRNEAKAYGRVAATHRQVKCRRSNMVHKFTHRATAKAAVICAEDLHVAGMVKNRSLALSVSDAGMGEVLRQLGYKSVWRGRHFVKIGRFEASSQTCSVCGAVHTEMKDLKRRRFVCDCGLDIDRDENAALNILRWGLRDLVRRGTPEVTPEGEPSSGRKTPRKGKGLRRNSARRTGNVEPHALPPNPVSA